MLLRNLLRIYITRRVYDKSLEEGAQLNQNEIEAAVESIIAVIDPTIGESLNVAFESIKFSRENPIDFDFTTLYPRIIEFMVSQDPNGDWMDAEGEWQNFEKADIPYVHRTLLEWLYDGLERTPTITRYLHLLEQWGDKQMAARRRKAIEAKRLPEMIEAAERDGDYELAELRTRRLLELQCGDTAKMHVDEWLAIRDTSSIAGSDVAEPTKLSKEANSNDTN